MANYKDRTLIGYIPTVLKEVKQFQALTHGEQPEVLNLFSEIETALNNQFVLTSTEYGVKRWEKILQITPKATYTLDERKFTILSRLAEELPFTYRMLEQILTELCGVGGFHMEARHNFYELDVQVKLTAESNLNDIKNMLKRVVPANLIIKLCVETQDMGYICVRIGGAAFRCIMQTTLPQYLPFEVFEKPINTVVFRASVEQTTLKEFS